MVRKAYCRRLPTAAVFKSQGHVILLIIKDLTDRQT